MTAVWILSYFGAFLAGHNFKQLVQKHEIKKFQATYGATAVPVQHSNVRVTEPVEQ